MKFIEYVKEQIEWLKGFFSEEVSPGVYKASSKRLAAIFTVLTLLTSYLKVSLFKQEVIEMPMTNAMLIAAIIGLSIWSNSVSGNKPTKTE